MSYDRLLKAGRIKTYNARPGEIQQLIKETIIGQKPK